MKVAESSVMQVTLTKDLQQFVAKKVQWGGYTSHSEVIREALRELRAKEDPAEEDSRELAELLLPAVRGPHRPLTDRDFNQLRRRARRKPVRR
jgi:putative addiction module CopG family antidote